MGDEAGPSIFRLITFLAALAISVAIGILLIGLMIESGFSVIFAVILEVFFILLIVYILHRNISRILRWISRAGDFEIGSEE